MIHLLSLVTAKPFTQEVCPRNTVSYVFSTKFHNITV